MAKRSRSVPKYILPIIVFAQFCGTSLWFASNAVIPNLINAYKLNEEALGHLTAAVQFGFICGTLIFAGLTLADRFSPSKLFCLSALLGALFNLGVLLPESSFSWLFSMRFLTGLFLAGIYPVGMKIAADYFELGLNKSLSFLVGALVLGTAFPHFLASFTTLINWNMLVVITSIIASAGGFLLVFTVPDGPYRKASIKLDTSAIFKVFKNKKLKAAAFGYFGHMWELYAFWAFVPVLLQTYLDHNANASLDTSLWSFIIIAGGSLSCVLGGYLAKRFGTKQIAQLALALSGLCCLFAPWMLELNSLTAFIAFLLFWGGVVITDSPLFSTLVAHNATPELKGTSLTLVNCIGFAITIVSIELLTYLHSYTSSVFVYSILAIGPILGLIGLRSTSCLET